MTVRVDAALSGNLNPKRIISYDRHPHLWLDPSCIIKKALSSSVALHAMLSRGDLSLAVPASVLAWGSSDQSFQRHWVHRGGLTEGRSGSLLPAGDAYPVWLRDLASAVVSGGIVVGCPAYVEWELAIIEHHWSDNAAVQCFLRLTAQQWYTTPPPVNHAFLVRRILDGSGW